MKTQLLVYASFLCLSFMLSCDDREINPYLCKAPSLISADQSCSIGNGLELTATSDNSSLELEWTIIALKDSAADGWTGNDLRVIATTASKTYTIPDSIVKTYKTLIVSTAAKCLDGSLLHSTYHRFIQTHPTGNNCIVWTLQNPE